jgi:hypothetical protein
MNLQTNFNISGFLCYALTIAKLFICRVEGALKVRVENADAAVLTTSAQHVVQLKLSRKMAAINQTMGM